MKKKMNVHMLIKVRDEDDVIDFLTILRDCGRDYKATCSDCETFTIIDFKMKRRRDYRKFEKTINNIGLRIKGKNHGVNELIWQC